MNTKTITAILIIIAIISAFFGGMKYNNKSVQYDSFFDSTKNKIETTYVNKIDTIRLRGKQIHTIDSIFIVDSTNISKIKSDTTKLKYVFDSVYLADSIDSATTVKYSQIYSAIETHTKFFRDSSKILLLDSQIQTCTTGLTELRNTAVELVDTAKTIAKIEYSRGYSDGSGKKLKTYFTVGAVALIIGFIVGGLY